MSIKKIFKGTLAATVIFTLVFHLAACGTLMYPERKGQKTGKIDPNVAILDAIGLLFFIIPGVIAFAVDFSNGTIYLPGTASLDSGDGRYGDWASLPIPADQMTRDGVENIIAAHTGVQDALSYQSAQVYEIDNLNEASQKLATMAN